MLLEFNDDGTITAELDVLGDPDPETERRTIATKKTITLRRPYAQDLLDLWEAFDKLQEQTAEAASAPDANGQSSGVLAARQTMVLNIEWYREVFRRLGDEPLDGIETLPSWMTGGRASVQMLQHWQDVP